MWYNLVTLINERGTQNVRTHNQNYFRRQRKIKIGSRTFAEKLANQYYECADIYCVELINIETGEIVYLRAKG